MKNPNPLIVFYFDSLSLHNLLIKDGFDSQRNPYAPNDQLYILKINEGDTPNKKYERLKEFFLFIKKLQNEQKLVFETEYYISDFIIDSIAMEEDDFIRRDLKELYDDFFHEF